MCGAFATRSAYASEIEAGWHAAPDAVFVLYYVSAEEFAAIVGRGSAPPSEGFITGPVGNP